MTESLKEFLDLVLTWSFLPLALSIALLLTAGSGLWRSRFTKLIWLAGLALLAATFCLGIGRHEWGEVLFNGQLL